MEEEMDAIFNTDQPIVIPGWASHDQPKEVFVVRIIHHSKNSSISTPTHS
jgi:hypothetical protein